jgi:hypothetical protein
MKNSSFITVFGNENYIDIFDYQGLAEYIKAFLLNENTKKIEKILNEADIDMSVKKFKEAVEQDLKSSL